MLSYRGANLLLDVAGRLDISVDDVHFLPEFDYGRNVELLQLFVLAYVKFLHDSPLRKDGVGKGRDVYMGFFSKLCHTFIPDLIRLYSELAHSIVSNDFREGGDSSTRVFEPRMMHTPVFREYHVWFKTGRPELLRFVLSFLTFGKKLRYEDPQFNTTAFRGWCEVEDRLRNLKLDPDVLNDLRVIVRALLPPLKVDLLVPKFGTGKVAEKGVADVYDKLRELAMHPRLSYAFFRDRPGRSSENGFSSVLRRMKWGASSLATCRQKFVPKDMTKSRTIAMEPNTFMYFQQEVLRWMVQAFRDGPISQFVRLEDQSRNRSAAVHGSIYGSVDTIDLSSASDSVHKDLVKGIFPPDYLFYLFATRTSKVEIYDGSEVRELCKFASMGSAVCFPVECVVFTAVCILAAMRYRAREGSWYNPKSHEAVLSFIDREFHKTWDSTTPFTWRFELPAIYGDDICVDTRLTPDVTSILTSLGFSVNTAKSFVGSQKFRESCGVFAFDGDDVTPFLFRLPHLTKGEVDAPLYASLIGMHNRARSLGYYELCSFILSVIKGLGSNLHPFVTDENEFGILVGLKHRPDPRNLRYRVEWHVDEELRWSIVPRYNRQTRPENLELYRYGQWWRSHVRGCTDSLQEGYLRIRPQETRLAPRWARCEM